MKNQGRSQNKRNSRCSVILTCGCKYKYPDLKKMDNHGLNSHFYLCEKHGKQRTKKIEYLCTKCGTKVVVEKIGDVRLTCEQCRFESRKKNSKQKTIKTSVQLAPTRYPDCYFYDYCMKKYLEKSPKSRGFSCEDCIRYTQKSMDIMNYITTCDTLSETRNFA